MLYISSANKSLNIIGTNESDINSKINAGL